MHTRASVTLGIIFLAAWLFPASTRAQSAVEVGYQLAHIPDETLPVGMSVGLVRSVRPTWSVVGEIAVARESHAAPGIEGQFTIVDVGGGVRWTPQITAPRVRPFVQIVVGAVRRTIDVEPDTQAGLDQSETDFMFQPGAGLAYRLTERWSALAAIKLTETLNENEFDIGDEYRLFFGARLDF